MIRETFFEKKKKRLELVLVESLEPGLHCHLEYEVVFAKKGKVIVTVNQNTYTLNSGEAVILFPNQFHEYNTIEIGEYFLVIFSSEYISIPEFEEVLPVNNVFSYDNDPKVLQLLNKAVERDVITNSISQTETIGYIYILIAYISPFIKKRPIADVDNLLYKVMKYSYDHYQENLTLERIANSLNVNKYHISHIVNEALSMNLRSYINFVRISIASKMLLNNKYSITDISSSVGFNNIRTFNRAFKEIYKVTPSEYRRKYSDI